MLIPADKIKTGMVVKMVGRGRKNRTTIHVHNITSAPLLKDIRIWGTNIMAPYGTNNRLCLITERTAMVEVVTENEKV